MNYYPKQLRAIVIYLEGLDALESQLNELGEETPYPSAVPLTDSGGTDWGVLRDEIGGAWSWTPPGETA